MSTKFNSLLLRRRQNRSTYTQCIDDMTGVVDDVCINELDSDLLEIILEDDIPDVLQNTELTDKIKPELYGKRDFTRKSSERDLAEDILLEGFDDLDTDDYLHNLRTTANDAIDLSDSAERKLRNELEDFLDTLVFDQDQTEPTLPLRAYNVDKISSYSVGDKEPEAYEVSLHIQKQRNTPTKLDNSIKTQVNLALKNWAKRHRIKDIDFDITLGN